MKKEKKSDIIFEHEIYIRNLLAKNLKMFRSDRRMSQMELASIAGVSTNYINEIENGKKSPSVETIAKLVIALSIEPFRFFTPEIMIRTDKADMLKTELSNLNNAVAELNEKMDNYYNDVSETGPEDNK